MKRICWVFSGILAVFFMILGSSTPVGAVGNEGPFKADYADVVYDSAGHTFRANFNSQGFYTGRFNGAETYSEACFHFPGLVIDNQNKRFNMTLQVASQFSNLGGQPISGSLSGKYGTTVFYDITSQGSFSSSSSIASALSYSHSLSGFLNGSGSTICFQGTLLSAHDASTAQWWLYAPTLSIYTSNEQLQLSTQERIEQLIQQGVKVNLDKSGLASSEGQQAQLDWQKEQAKKEEEQRKEDEKKAQDVADSSQSSSDSDQSQVDTGSASLFSVVNSVKDVILQGSDSGNCNISGNFGFFNAGNIDLCTGGSKIRPITTVVGTIMLTFFVFTSAITLLHKFLDLYHKWIGD